MGRGGVGSFGACVIALNMAIKMIGLIPGLMFDDFKIIIGDDDFGLRRLGGIGLWRGGDVEREAFLFEQSLDANLKRGENLNRGILGRRAVRHLCLRSECRMKNGQRDGLGLLVEQRADTPVRAALA